LIEAALAKKDIQVARPDYDADFSAKAEVGKEGDGEEEVSKVDDDEEEEE
jgi:hypothetical protein